MHIHFLYKLKPLAKLCMFFQVHSNPSEAKHTGDKCMTPLLMLHFDPLEYITASQGVDGPHDVQSHTDPFFHSDFRLFLFLTL